MLDEQIEAILSQQPKERKISFELQNAIDTTGLSSFELGLIFVLILAIVMILGVYWYRQKKEKWKISSSQHASVTIKSILQDENQISTERLSSRDTLK